MTARLAVLVALAAGCAPTLDARSAAPPGRSARLDPVKGFWGTKSYRVQVSTGVAPHRFVALDIVLAIVASADPVHVVLVGDHREGCRRVSHDRLLNALWRRFGRWYPDRCRTRPAACERE